MTYEEWYLTTEHNWMTSAYFFLGSPIVTEDAPTSTAIRASVYDWIFDTYAGRTIGCNDATRWGQLFKSALTRVNGSFWKMWQMDQLLRIKDMVTADYSAFTQSYAKGSDAQQSQHTNSSESIYSTNVDTTNTTNPTTITNIDTYTQGKVTTKVTPISAAQQVTMQSNLAESTYIDGVTSEDSESTLGMPKLDTSHGDSASGSWSLSEGSITEESQESPTGNSQQTTSEVKNTGNSETDSNSGASGTQADYIKHINDSLNGTVSEGHRDYNGYNLSASIQAVSDLLPYDYLEQFLNPLFYGIMGEEDD